MDNNITFSEQTVFEILLLTSLYVNDQIKSQVETDYNARKEKIYINYMSY